MRLFSTVQLTRQLYHTDKVTQTTACWGTVPDGFAVVASAFAWSILA